MGQGFHHRTIDLAELADELQALARAAKEHAAAAGTNDPEDAAPFKDMLQGVGGLYNTLDATETEKRCAAAWRKQQPLGADQVRVLVSGSTSWLRLQARPRRRSPRCSATSPVRTSKAMAERSSSLLPASRTPST